MKIIKSVNQAEVFSHWETVERKSIFQRIDIVFPLVAYGNVIWSLAKLEDTDIDKIYICSSSDWLAEGLCFPDFKLTTTVQNYQNSNYGYGKYQDIKVKEDIFLKNPNVLDTKLILVSDKDSGPYTIIEGCKRAVALSKLEKLVGINIYIGISPSIKAYVWARHMYGS